MRIIVGARSNGANIVLMRDKQFSADATYVSKMETPNVVTLEMEDEAERILLITVNGDEKKGGWVIETDPRTGDQWLSRRQRTPLSETVQHDAPVPYRVKGGRTEV